MDPYTNYEPSRPANLAGEVALITGATRGLGLEMAKAFASCGANIVVSSRKADACERIAADLVDRFGVEAVALPCNVSHWASCNALVEEAYAQFGRVDILVNNAGLSPLYGALDEVEEALFDKVIAVNLKGPFRISSLVAKRMFAEGGGRILNISSVASADPDPAALPYAAAKAGLDALTLGFARAFAPTVRVNGILAGPFLTDIADAWDRDEFSAKARTSILLQRGGDPKEIVGAAVYLVSNASSFTTGALLRVDGGYAWPRL